MPTIPLTFDALAGLAIGLIFAIVCARNLSRGVVAFVALAWLPVFQVATLRGIEFQTGLLQVEWLASLLIAARLLTRPTGGRPWVVPAPFNGPLLLLLPLAVVSLVTGFLDLDPAIETSHARLPVSIGQILLYAWPIGVYLVTASAITSSSAVRQVTRLLVVMSVPTLALPVVPAPFHPFVSWSVYFAIATSPIAFAKSLQPATLAAKTGWLLLALAPVVHGLQTGKALWYVAPLVGAATIAMLRARRLLVVLAPAALGLYLLVYVPATGSLLPGPLQRLMAQEQEQQSWGGQSGRQQLALDALRIWQGHPVFGVGPGNNYPYMIRYSTIATPHGQYLNILLEMGLVGLACYLAFLVTAFRWGLGVQRAVRDPHHQVVVLGWLGLFAGMAVGGLFGDFTLHSIRNDGLRVFSWYYHQWVLLGLVVAITRIEAR